MTGDFARTLKGHMDAVWTLVARPNGQLASGSQDFTSRIWDTKTGECVRMFEWHTHKVTSVTVLPSGQFASGSYDKTARIWNL